MSIKYTSTEKHNIKQYVKYKVGDSKDIVDVLIISRASKALKKKRKKKKKKIVQNKKRNQQHFNLIQLGQN